jgi:hypothetical protein
MTPATDAKRPGAPVPGAGQGMTQKQLYLRRKAMMWSERSSWEGDWLDLIDYLAPYSGRFTASDANKGDKTQRAKKMLQTTARRSLKTLAAGLMGGMTSPARPWFRLTIPDREMRENQNVKRWLQGVTELMREIFSQSNTYRALHQAYTELGAFGTTANVLMPDFDNVIHIYSIPIGEYALAADGKGRVNTMVREYNMTVGQMVDEFGYNNVSTVVKDHWTRGNLDQWITVQQIIEPRVGRDVTKRDMRMAKYKSCYYEANRQDVDTMLEESGYARFPVLAARWDVNGNDVYGTGPGHDAIADIKEAQFFKSRRANAIDYQTNPPLQVPGSLKSSPLNRLPGGVSYVSQAGAENSVRSLFDVNLDLNALQLAMQETVALIKSHFYEDLFLMLANDTRSGITATEVAERHEEKLLMLGPVLERLHNEMLSPLIDFTFERIAESGLLVGALEPPREIQGMDISVQYVSTLAQAQRAVGLNSFDRLIATVGALAGAKQDPSVWDKVDTDQIIDEYAEGLGVTPAVIRSDEDVAALRQQRAQQEQAMQAAAAAQAAADTAKTVGETDLANVQDAAGMFMGYGSPTPVEAAL